MKVYIPISIFISSLLLLPIQAEAGNHHIQACEKGFIGYEYNPKLDKQCSKLWSYWSRQILSNKR